MKRNPRRQAGFTLVELVVAGGIMAIVTVQVLLTLSNQVKTYSVQKRVGDVQEDARLSGEMMVRDIRLAGFMVPVMAGISTIDGGANAADTLCTSDASVFSDATLDAAMERFGGAPLTTALGGSTGTLSLGSLDIDFDANNDFGLNRGIIISSGAMSHCARIIEIGGTTVKFEPPTPPGFLAAVGPSVAVPAIVYELTAQGLFRNTLLVSEQVEDLQIEFAVDNDGDGTIAPGEFPIHDLTGSNLSAIRGVQLSVLTRGELEDPDFSGPGREAVANRAAGDADSFRRRLVSVAAAPRNLQ